MALSFYLSVSSCAVYTVYGASMSSDIQPAGRLLGNTGASQRAEIHLSEQKHSNGNITARGRPAPTAHRRPHADESVSERFVLDLETKKCEKY